MPDSQPLAREFTERFLKFSFDSSWRVEKYDSHHVYERLRDQLDGTKGVDFVGCQTTPRRILYLIEAKDFRNYSIAQRQEMKSGSLTLEVGQKVRDTLAGLVGAHRQLASREQWHPFLEGIHDPQTELRIIFWFESDASSPRIESSDLTTLANDLKRKLRWLTTKVVVLSSRYGHPPPGLAVTSLARGT